MIPDPYSKTMRALLDRLQYLYDVADVAKHHVIEFRLARADYVLYYDEVARHYATPHGGPIYAGIPVRCGVATTAIVEPRS